GQHLVAFGAGRQAEVVADCRSRDIQAQPEGELLEVDQVVFPEVLRKVVAGQFRAIEIQVGAQAHEIVERHRGAVAGELLADGIGGQTQFHVRLAVALDWSRGSRRGSAACRRHESAGKCQLQKAAAGAKSWRIQLGTGVHAIVLHVYSGEPGRNLK